jgi:diguanylate cyclase (GGDEF)-like protein
VLDRSINRLIVLAMFVLFGHALAAQRFSFQRYGEAQGLLDLVITDVIQDHDGFIWAATFNGVYRYDGTSFQRFGQAEGVQPSMTLFLIETPDGTLWVVSDHSISRLEGNHFHNFELGVNLTGPQPVAWLKGSNTFALATTAGLASVAVQHGGLGVITMDPASKGKPVTAVYAAQDGLLWYSRGSEICRRGAVETRCFGSSEGIPPDRWTGIRMDRNRDLWIRSEKRIFHLQAGSVRFETGPVGLPPADGTGLLNLDRDGNLFVPTQRGLARLIDGKWSLVSMRQGMTSDSVQVAMEDREGSLWIGHLGGGLERWRGYDSWEGWTELEGLANSSILAILPDSAKHVFLGTDRGLIEFQAGRGTVRRWLEHDGLAGDHVFALAFDHAGNLWTGSSAAGLSLMNRRTGRIRRIPEGGSDDVISLIVDSDDSVWAATSHRLLRFVQQGGRGFRLSTPPGTPVGYIAGLLLDRSGRLWTVASGNLYLLEAHHWRSLGVVQGLQAGSALNLAEGSDGAIFVLAFSGRVFRLVPRDGGWIASALPPLLASGSLVPYFLRSDRSGTLWVGTDRGVFTFEANSRDWRWYTEDDGLVWNDINVNSFHTGLADDVWIGTSRGLAHYTPARIKSFRPTPHAAIVSLAVNGRTLTGEGPFFSNYPASSVQFHITALTYTNEERNRFLYRLRGIDADWLRTSSHEIVYSDLRPGKYTFDVLAESPDGKVSSEPASVTLTVRPPWYLTRTFIALAVAGGSLLLAIAFRWRTHSFLVRQRELEVAVAERTSELQVKRRFERDQAQILEMIVSAAELDDVLNSIAAMVRTYSPGIRCSISSHAPLPCIDTQATKTEILSTIGEPIGWMDITGENDTPSYDSISKVVSVARRLATVAIEARGSYEKLDHQANHDLLTGLPNRLHFQKRIEEVLRNAIRDHEGFAVIYIDLDRFKEVNDRYGHRIGDQYLQELSNRFRSCMRKGDLLARLGGDEFATLLLGADSDVVAERVVRDLEASLLPPVLFHGCRVQAYASFGFSLYPKDAADSESLLRAADQAMYRAKRRNKELTRPRVG